MSFRTYSMRFAVSAMAAGFIAAANGGCSSDNGGSPTDAGSDVVIHRTLDGSGAIGDDAATSDGTFDETTGKACSADKDCVSDAGPGVNVCSSNFPGAVGTVQVQFWSTPVCIVPPTTACDPAPLGEALGPHYCDGPDDIGSPGICVPFDPSDPQPGQGLCYPKCTYTLGASATGCAGSNVCNLDWFFAPTGTSSAITGVGFCGSICQTDADCSALGTGYSCQTDIGLCTTKKLARAKPFGASCFAASDGGADDNTTGACNCLSGANGSGFCTSSCVAGGVGCPNGWVCETEETSVPFTGAPAETSQTKGVGGFCVPGCSLDDAGVPEAGPVPEASTSDAGEADDAAVEAGMAPTGVEAGASCPPSTVCQATTLAGPDCLPPPSP